VSDLFETTGTSPPDDNNIIDLSDVEPERGPARPESLHTLWELSEQGRVRFDRSDMTPRLVALAEKYAHTHRRLYDYLDRQNDFVYEVGANTHLSDGQAKGVLNVLIAQLRGQRKRWHQNNGDRLDCGSCIVCGLGLSGDGEGTLGAGTKCWSRLIGNWS